MNPWCQSGAAVGSIVKRTRKDGTVSYRAQIRIRRQGADISESRTFSKRKLASEWIRRREGELEQPGELQRAGAPGTAVVDLIERYIEEFAELQRWSRTKLMTLRFLQRQPIGQMDACKVTATDVVDYIRQRRIGGASGPTVVHDLAYLGAVFDTAVHAWQLPVAYAEVMEARRICRRLRLTGTAAKRTRRPTLDELARLDARFRRHSSRGRIPMNDIMWFAIFSARRLAEITRIQWNDNDESKRTGIVRDAKHPTKKWGNDRQFKYTPEAWAIVNRQPRIDDRIFPYNPHSIGAVWQRATKLLGIADLHFHDLRHEATSRLFERGYQIHEVALFTLHESWDELRRYTQLRAEDVPER